MWRMAPMLLSLFFVVVATVLSLSSLLFSSLLLTLPTLFGCLSGETSMLTSSPPFIIIAAPAPAPAPALSGEQSKERKFSSPSSPTPAAPPSSCMGGGDASVSFFRVVLAERAPPAARLRVAAEGAAAASAASPSLRCSISSKRGEWREREEKRGK
jgi:hypothetical protein